MPVSQRENRNTHLWEHENIIEDHKKWTTVNNNSTMVKRKALVEHPFGTIKNWCGWTHLMVRAKRKVSGEWGLLTFVYYFKRVLSILGLDGFREICSKRWTLRENIKIK